MTGIVELLQDLIKFQSVSPSDAGAMDWITDLLKSLGFKCININGADSITKNLYASIGKGEKNLCFAGHLDVVPSGAENDWLYPPFSGAIKDGMVYGRGAVDMKGAIASYLFSVMRFLKEGKNFSRLSFILTSDEEGTGKYGTIKVVEFLKENNISITDCIIGEPTSVDFVGDMVKIGRRGSINFSLEIHGLQGHVAYPDLALNPINKLMEILYDLKGHPIDLGYDFFQPSHLEITSIDVGNKTANIIPSAASAKFNIRFNPNYTAEKLVEWVSDICDKHNIKYTLSHDSNSEAFLSSKGRLYDITLKTLSERTEITPRVSTSGGTSDARFIKELCPVLEIGLRNEKAHHVNESVSIDDLKKLSEIYYNILINYFQKDC